MKKVKILVILSLGMLLTVTAIPSLAAQGIWRSGYAYDANGASNIGTQSSTYGSNWFQLRLQRANGVYLSHYTVQLGHSQSVNKTFWTTPLVDKRAVVSASSHVHFAPWWNT